MSAAQTTQDFPANQKKDLPIALTTKDCNGKTYIVTGGTGGLGSEAAKHLVRLEAAKVIISARSKESGAAAKATIEAATGRKGVVDVWLLDLASYDSVKAFAKKVGELDRIDALVLNAGALYSTWEEKEGNESSITVNFISNFLLALLSLPQLQVSAQKHEITPRLVVVGSMSGLYAEDSAKRFTKTGILDDLSKRDKWESDMDYRYAVSKALVHMAARELASLLPVSQSGVIINVIDPGLCKTGLTRNQKFSQRIKVSLAKALLGRTPEMGSRTLLHGVSADEESHGKYLTSCVIREDHIPNWITSQSGQVMQTQIWTELVEKLEKIQPGSVTDVVEN